MSRGKMEGMDIIHPWGVPVALFLTYRWSWEVLRMSKPKRKIRLCHYVCVRPLLPFGLLSLRLFLLLWLRLPPPLASPSSSLQGIAQTSLTLLLLRASVARHSSNKFGSALASLSLPWRLFLLCASAMFKQVWHCSRLVVGSAKQRLNCKGNAFIKNDKILLRKYSVELLFRRCAGVKPTPQDSTGDCAEVLVTQVTVPDWRMINRESVFAFQETGHSAVTVSRKVSYGYAYSSYR